MGGDILFNVDHAVMQYCNDTDWIAFPKYDQSPTPFTLTDLTNQAQTTLVTSNTITLNGFDNTVFVNIAGDGSPEFRINGGAWVTTASVVPGDTLQVRMTTAGAGGVTNTASVTVGTYTENWDVSTTGPDTTPDAFSFTDQTGLALSTLAVSNSIIISGINASTPVSVSGGGSPEIRINGGAWVTSGNITSGQSLEVRLTSSGSGNTMLSATLDVGGVTDQWDVTTAIPGSAVSLLLHSDGANGATTFPDSSTYGVTVSRGGNTVVSTAQSKFGGSSAYFDGSGDYLGWLPTSLTNFGTDDFTVELWFRTEGLVFQGEFPWRTGCLINATSETGVLMFLRNATTTSGQPPTNLIVGKGNMSLNNATFDIAYAFANNTWYHVALSRVGGVGYVFINGVLQASGAMTDSFGSIQHRIGGGINDNNWASWFKGYIDEVRITDGYGRYTADFTPESVAFPDP